MIRPGNTKMIDDNVPAADAIVCTMLFSWIVESLKPRSSAIEMTAAGIDVANVSPAFSPKKTFAAVNTTVMITPRMTPRIVNSVRGAEFAFSATCYSPFLVMCCDIPTDCPSIADPARPTQTAGIPALTASPKALQASGEPRGNRRMISLIADPLPSITKKIRGTP